MDRNSEDAAYDRPSEADPASSRGPILAEGTTYKVDWFILSYPFISTSHLAWGHLTLPVATHIAANLQRRLGSQPHTEAVSRQV